VRAGRWTQPRRHTSGQRTGHLLLLAILLTGPGAEAVRVQAQGSLPGALVALVIGTVVTGEQTLRPVPPVTRELEDVALTFRPDSRALLLGVGTSPGASFTVLGLP